MHRRLAWACRWFSSTICRTIQPNNTTFRPGIPSGCERWWRNCSNASPRAGAPLEPGSPTMCRSISGNYTPCRKSIRQFSMMLQRWLMARSVGREEQEQLP